MTQHYRVTEYDVSNATVCILKDFGEPASVRRIIRAIPRYLSLNDNDRVPSLTRPGEEVWEQQVRNIVSHRFCEGNFICDGLLRYQRGRLALADNDDATRQPDLFGR
jgi:hypothetical protein